MKRRNFLELLAGLPLLGQTAFATPTNTGEISNIVDTICNTNNGIIVEKLDEMTEYDVSQFLVPDKLKAGDTVAFTAPASPISYSKISNYIDFFKSKACKVVVGDTIKLQANKHRYFSATDSERAKELNAFINEPAVKAIICGRGGYGVMRILPDLDYYTLRNNPKFIMGYSDITALLLAIHRCANIVTLHGPVGSSKFSDSHKLNIENIFFNSNNTICYKVSDMQVAGDFTTGIFSGKLQGGNLSLIAATMGTPYEIDLDNAVFFFEDTSVQAHEVDRMLTNLWLANKFNNCKGFVVGKMKDIDKRGNFFPNKAFTIREIILDFANKLNIPCVFNVSFGHMSSEIIFPIGIVAQIDTNKKELILNL